MYVYVLEVPGLIFSAFIVDRVGRKLSMVIMFVLASVLLLPLLIHQNEILTTGLLFGARAFVSATFVVACIYAPEVCSEVILETVKIYPIILLKFSLQTVSAPTNFSWLTIFNILHNFLYLFLVL